VNPERLTDCCGRTEERPIQSTCRLIDCWSNEGADDGLFTYCQHGKMGAAQSTPRRLTVRNDEPRIIQVSEDVIRRLSATRTTNMEQKTKATNTSAEPPLMDRVPTPTKNAVDQRPSVPSTAIESQATHEEVLAAEDEFKKTLAHFEKLLGHAQKVKVNACQEISAQVAECYSNHPTQVLRCAEVVKKFAECTYRSPVAS